MAVAAVDPVIPVLALKVGEILVQVVVLVLTIHLTMVEQEEQALRIGMDHHH
jgi:hypothetical protein|tara:strand:- start:298 stop:453 length:156 start_codon:yes stop_codon:yes gene_type:complete